MIDPGGGGGARGLGTDGGRRWLGSTIRDFAMIMGMQNRKISDFAMIMGSIFHDFCQISKICYDYGVEIKKSAMIMGMFEENFLYLL